MIFVTVGTQLNFDRLVGRVDKWADTADEKVVAQIGPSELTPQNIEWCQFLSPDEFIQYMDAAKVIIAHAGTGSILTAMQKQKPIIIMPRQAVFNEHRNDHQVATAKRFMHMDGIHVAMDEDELLTLLQNMELISASDGVGPNATDELLDTIRDFIAREPC